MDKKPDEILKENINKKKLQMLENYSLPEFPVEIKSKLLKYLINIGVDPEIINC